MNITFFRKFIRSYFLCLINPYALLASKLHFEPVQSNNGSCIFKNQKGEKYVLTKYGYIAIEQYNPHEKLRVLTKSYNKLLSDNVEVILQKNCQKEANEKLILRLGEIEEELVIVRKALSDEREVTKTLRIEPKVSNKAMTQLQKELEEVRLALAKEKEKNANLNSMHQDYLGKKKRSMIKGIINSQDSAADKLSAIMKLIGG